MEVKIAGEQNSCKEESKDMGGGKKDKGEKTKMLLKVRRGRPPMGRELKKRCVKGETKRVEKKGKRCLLGNGWVRGWRGGWYRKKKGLFLTDRGGSSFGVGWDEVRHFWPPQMGGQLLVRVKERGREG